MICAQIVSTNQVIIHKGTLKATPKEYQNLYCCCCLVVRRAHGRGDAKFTGRWRGDILIFRHIAVRIGGVVDWNTRTATCCGATKKCTSINRGSAGINARQKSEHTR
jgi:hypothetical protein